MDKKRSWPFGQNLEEERRLYIEFAPDSETGGKCFGAGEEALDIHSFDGFHSPGYRRNVLRMGCCGTWGGRGGGGVRPAERTVS